MVVTVQLTKKQIQYTRGWVQMKRAEKLRSKSHDLWYDEHSDSLTVDLMGRLGEIAAAEAFNLDWTTDLDWSISAGGDSGSDLRSYGMTWDVKTSTLPFLIFNSPRHFKSRAAVLVQLIGDRTKPDAEDALWVVHGVCSSATFRAKCVDVQYAGRDRVHVPAESLTQFIDFVDKMEEIGV
jgi:hypothetical protein